MPYSRELATCADTFSLLGRKEALELCKRWRSVFEAPDVQEDDKLPFVRIRAVTDTEFYALFDYESSHIPVTYECNAAEGFADFDPPYVADWIVVNKAFTWSIVFHHEDGSMWAGPRFLWIDDLD